MASGPKDRIITDHTLCFEPKLQNGTAAGPSGKEDRRSKELLVEAPMGAWIYSARHAEWVLLPHPPIMISGSADCLSS